MRRYPTPFQRRTLWNAATGMAILVLGLLVVGLFWLIGRLFGFLQPVLVPVIVAAIIAYVLEPAVVLLEKRGLRRVWAVSAIFGGIGLALLLLVVTILPGVQRGHANLKAWLGKPESGQAIPASESRTPGQAAQGGLSRQLERQLRTLSGRYHDTPIGWALEEVDDEGRPLAGSPHDAQSRPLASYARSRAGRMIFEYKGAIFQTARSWLTAGSTKILGFLGFSIGLIMVPVYLFFFLKESAGIRAHWHDYVPLRASRFKSELIDTLQEINGYLVSFFRGQVLVAVIDGLLVGIALSIFGLPYGFVIGAFMAILGVIPYIGNILCLIPACVIAWLHAQGGDASFGLGPWAYVGAVVAIFVVVQQINSLVTAPKIVGDSVGLHPLTVIFSMLFWSLVLGGFVGALLAVPLTAALKVLFRRFIWIKQIRKAEGNAVENEDAGTA